MDGGKCSTVEACRPYGTLNHERKCLPRTGVLGYQRTSLRDLGRFAAREPRTGVPGYQSTSLRDSDTNFASHSQDSRPGLPACAPTALIVRCSRLLRAGAPSTALKGRLWATSVRGYSADSGFPIRSITDQSS